MSVRSSTIEDLKFAIRELEEKKRKMNEEYDALLASLHSSLRYLDQDGEQPASTSPTVATPGAGRPPARANPLRDAMFDILNEEGPLHRNEVHDRLVERGIAIPGQNPIGNVGAHLSHDPRFENVSWGVWGIAKQGDEQPQPASPDQAQLTEGEEDIGLADSEALDDAETESDEEDSLPW